MKTAATHRLRFLPGSDWLVAATKPSAQGFCVMLAEGAKQGKAGLAQESEHERATVDRSRTEISMIILRKLPPRATGNALTRRIAAVNSGGIQGNGPVAGLHQSAAWGAGWARAGHEPDTRVAPALTRNASGVLFLATSTLCLLIRSHDVRRGEGKGHGRT